MPVSGPSFIGLHKDGTLLTEFLQDVQRHEPQWRVGAMLRLPRFFLAYCVDHLEEWSQLASFVLADPETRQMVLPYAKRGRGRGDHRYLAESNPAANRQRFVTETLHAQVVAGATTLISPWLIHNLSGTGTELDVTLDLAQRALAHPLAGGKKVLVGLEATDTVFANPDECDKFIDRVVELEEADILMRMTTPATLTGFGQYANTDAVAGLRRAVKALVDNDHNVLIAQAGIAGWILMGAGALSFSAGIAGTLQRSGMPEDREGGGSGQQLEWYFLPEFLGFVQSSEMPGLAGVQGFQACDCPWCAGSLPGTGAAFDRVAANKHFLWWCAKLANDLAGEQDQAQAVRDRLAEATSFWEAVQQAAVVLDARSEPKHLAAWTAAAA